MTPFLVTVAVVAACLWLAFFLTVDVMQKRASR